MAKESGAESMSKFYSFDEIDSKNGTYNFIVGGRGIGKTYGAKKKVILDFLRLGHQFIYLRRYKEERMAAGNFFADVGQEFPDDEFRVHQHELQHKTPDDKWETMGYVIALSTAQKLKSKVFNEVHTIIFDEFILEKGFTRYLPQEESAFNNFYSTVDRWNDRVKVYFLANAVSINNPYFVAYKIDADREWVKRKRGFIVVHFPQSTEFNNEAEKTRFGQFIAGTEYSDYALGNQFADNTPRMIGEKPHSARYFCSIDIDGSWVSLWKFQRDSKRWFYGSSKQPRETINFTLDPNKVSEECVYLAKNADLTKVLRTAFGHGRMLFDKPATRNLFLSIY